MFISEEDGRESLVDLTKTLCDMAQRGKLSSDDVSVELVDAEVKGGFYSLLCEALQGFPAELCSNTEGRY